MSYLRNAVRAVFKREQELQDQEETGKLVTYTFLNQRSFLQKIGND